MESPVRPPVGRLRYVVTNLLTAVVLYANAALLTNAVSAGIGVSWRLPIDFLIGGLFNVFPVFTTYEGVNTEVVLLGLPRGADAGDEQAWVRLDVDAYFPSRLGEQHARVLAATRARVLSREDRLAAWETITRKVRARHNRTHPERPIERVRIRILTWPRSPQGYRARRAEGVAATDLYTGPST